MVGEEFNCVRDTDGFCCRYVALKGTVMMGDWSNVEPLCTVGSPGWALICLVVNNYFAACRGQGGVIEIGIAVYLCVDGDSWVDAGRSQEVQCDDSLGDEKVPTI